MAAAVAAAAPAKPPAPTEPRPINIDNDFNERCYLGRCKEASAPDLVAPKPLGPSLTHDEISTEMRKVEAGVRICGRAVDANGRIVVRLVISVDGRINTATVTGRLADTPFAMCVERTLRSVRFRRNQGLEVMYPFSFQASAGVADCGAAGGAGKKVNVAALQHLGAPLGRCGGTGAVKIPVRLAVDARGVIRGAEAQSPYGGTREGFCVERALACLLGSIADGLPKRWEDGLNARAGSPATLRPLQP
jgi:hypothetical protein